MKYCCEYRKQEMKKQEHDEIQDKWNKAGYQAVARGAADCCTKKNKEETTEKVTETATEKVTKKVETTTKKAKKVVKKSSEKATKAKSNSNGKSTAKKYIGKNMDELVAAIGKYKSMDKDKSCLEEGEYDGFFYYDGFTVSATTKNGQWIINSVD